MNYADKLEILKNWKGNTSYLKSIVQLHLFELRNSTNLDEEMIDKYKEIMESTSLRYYYYID